MSFNHFAHTCELCNKAAENLKQAQGNCHVQGKKDRGRNPNRKFCMSQDMVARYADRLTNPVLKPDRG